MTDPYRIDSYVGFHHQRGKSAVRAAKYWRLAGDREQWVAWMDEAAMWREKLIDNCRKPHDPKVLRVRAESKAYRERANPPWT